MAVVGLHVRTIVSTGQFRRVAGEAHDPDSGIASDAAVPVLGDVKVIPEHLSSTRAKLADIWPS